MKLENDYKHMMQKIRPVRKLHVEDLTENVKQPGAGRFIAVLVPAALIILLAVFIPRGLFGGKQAANTDASGNEGLPADIAAAEDTEEIAADTSEKTVQGKDPEAHAEAENQEPEAFDDTEIAENAETGNDSEVSVQASEAGGRSGGIIIAENKTQAVGNVRLYFEDMKKDYEAHTVTEFLEIYPETGEAYQRYYDMLYSSNPGFYAEMVYTWLDPGHPENADGDFLIVGLRQRVDIEGPGDVLNDEEHPYEGPDMSNYSFHGWAYLYGYLYRYDETEDRLIRIETPGRYFNICRDLTFEATINDSLFRTEDGTELDGYQLQSYLKEDGSGYTVELVSQRQTQTEIFFSVSPEGEVLTERACVVMISEHDYAADEYTELADPADRAAYDELYNAHGGIQEPMVREGEELLSWTVLDKNR